MLLSKSQGALVQVTPGIGRCTSLNFPPDRTQFIQITIEIKRADVVTFAEAPGMAVSLNVKYEF